MDATEQQPTNGTTLTPLLLDRAGVAALLTVKAGAVDHLHRIGKLKAVRVGKSNRWRRADVEEFVQALQPDGG